METFSPADRKVLRDYASFQEKVKKTMEELRKRLSRRLGLIQASDVRRGRGYVYFCSFKGGAELCPGIKYGQEFIIMPVLWVATQAQLETLGYARDEEFPEYYIKESKLEESFFEKDTREQLDELEDFFAEEVRRLRLLGIIDEYSPTAMG